MNRWLFLRFVFSLAIAVLIMRVALPLFANLFAGLGVEIHLPTAWVVAHPALAFAYLVFLAAIPFLLVVALIVFSIRQRRKRTGLKSTHS